MSTTWRSRVTSTSSSAKTKKQRLGKPECTASSEASAAASRERASSATWEEHQPARSWKNTTKSWARVDSKRQCKKTQTTFTSSSVSTSGTEHYDSGQKKQTLRVQHPETLSIWMCCKSLMSSIKQKASHAASDLIWMLTTTTTVIVISSREHSQKILSHRTLK